VASIAKMKKREAVSRDEFYELLDAWFKTTNESTVGDVVNNAGVTAWVWVRVGEHTCRLHADATRDGVSQFLHMKREADGELAWHVIANNRGNFNKVAFGSNKQIIPGIFLYLGTKAERGSRLG
jgi:hypothetical protein